jgi:hypothetical protein
MLCCASGRLQKLVPRPVLKWCGLRVRLVYTFTAPQLLPPQVWRAALLFGLRRNSGVPRWRRNKLVHFCAYARLKCDDRFARYSLGDAVD